VQRLCRSEISVKRAKTSYDIAAARAFAHIAAELSSSPGLCAKSRHRGFAQNLVTGALRKISSPGLCTKSGNAIGVRKF
jgi:hypothetical protein